VGEAASIKTLGWQQGSVLPAEVVIGIADQVAAQNVSPEGLEHAWVVVVSQDCDLVHGSYDAEPFVELVIGRPIDEVDAVKMHGRNPRLLHLVGHAGADSVCLAFSVHEKVPVLRDALSDHDPCTLRRIDAGDVDMMAEWLAKRHTRAAFPDAFNDRLIPAHKKIDKVLKKSGEFITGIFLALSSWDELPIESKYKVILRATAQKGDLKVAGVEKDLAAVVVKLVQATNTCKGIAVIDGALVSEAEFTLDDLGT
jgi:hypothetical protein